MKLLTCVSVWHCHSRGCSISRLFFCPEHLTVHAVRWDHWDYFSFSQTCHLTAAWGGFLRIHWYSEKLVCNRLLSRTMHAPSVLITQCSLAEKTRGSQQVNSFHYPRHYVNGKALLYYMLLSVPCHLYDSLLTGCLFRSYDRTSGLRFDMPCGVNLS